MLSAMSQPPPWETQPPPGWGPPQPPAQQPGESGWNQGPYSPQYPPSNQYPPAQYPSPSQYPPPSQQPYPPPYGQNQYPPPSPFPDGEPPRKRRNNGRTAGIVGTALLLVAGCAMVVVLATRHSGSGTSGGAPQAAPSVTADATTSASSTMTFPDNSFPASGASSSSGSADGAQKTPTDPSSATGGPSAADPASLDSAATDKTPFTAAGLVAPQFKDDKNVVYKLTAASAKPCDKVGDQAVATIVKSAKCTQFFAASWTDSSGRIIVSAMIVPYQDAATAKRISDKLGATAHTGDYNQWCPPAGQPHADVCAKLTAAATREGKFGSFHRYVLITTAVYSDLRTDDAQKDWLVAAAGGAFQNTLPGM